MGTKSKNVFVNQEMVDEFNEKYSKATTEAEKNNLLKEYYTKMFTIE